MLADIVEKAERTRGGVTTKTGSCKFCKQAAMRKVLCEWNQEEIDELATETCECVNARIYTHKKSQKERAHNKIDLLFGENNTTVIVPMQQLTCCIKLFIRYVKALFNQQP